MRPQGVEAALLTTLGLGWIGGCSLVANLGRFDGATAAGPLDGAQDDGAPIGVDAANGADGSAAQDGPDASTAVDAIGGDSDGGRGDARAPEAGDAGDGNLIQNPGFELGIAPWTTFVDGTILPTLATSSMHAHSGTYSGWVSARTKSFQGTVQDIRQAAVPGHTYSVSAWALIGYPPDAGPPDGSSTPAEPVNVTAAVTCAEDAGMPSYIHVGGATASSSVWSEITGTLTVPTCTITVLQVYLEGPAPGVDLYVDDVSVVP